MAKGVGIPAFWASLAGDLRHMEDYLFRTLGQASPPVREVTTHLLKAGGKRIRPALVLLAARLSDRPQPNLYPVAAAVEMVHMATLVHDDIIDHSPLRRGQPTVHRVWNERVAVLVGDHLFAESFLILTGTGDHRLVQALSRVVSSMCAGEIAQNLSPLRPEEVTEEQYLERIGRKTAEFLGASAQVGGFLAGASAAVTDALYRFGYGIGLGFQIIDDVLDLTAESALFGKAVGSDLREGVPTLPLIHALNRSPQRHRLLELTSSPGKGDAYLQEVMAILGESGSLAYTMGLARQKVEEARRELAVLPSPALRETLSQVADFVLERAV